MAATKKKAAKKAAPKPASPTPGDPAASAAAATLGEDEQRRTDLPASEPINEQTPQPEPEPAGEGYVSRLPQLVVGATGEIVMLLARALHRHGFKNAVAEGRAAAVLTDDLMGVVKEFQASRGHDPRNPEKGAERAAYPLSHLGVVDARTWEHLGLQEREQ